MGSEGEHGASLEVECPHCHKRFNAEVIEGSAARYRGFKCPHCRLFVPLHRATDATLTEPLSRDPDAAS
jgi:phage FluMu protein Com